MQQFKSICCPLSFKNKVDLKRHHLQTHAGMFTCFVCDKTFKFKEKYKRHAQTHLAKGEKNSPRNIEKLKQNTFLCDKCDFLCE